MADLSAQLVRGKQAAFEYKPIGSEELSFAAKTAIQQQALRQKAKATQQQKYLDDIAKIQGLGLPKAIQQKISADTDQIITDIRTGKLTNNVDVMRRIATVSGEATQYQNLVDDINENITKEMQIVVDGVDLADDTKSGYLNLYQENYKDQDLFKELTKSAQALTRGTTPLEFEVGAVQAGATAWLNANKSTYKDIEQYKKQGFEDYNIINEMENVSQTDLDAYTESIKNSTFASLYSQYLTDKKIIEGAGKQMVDFETYQINALEPYLPKKSRQVGQEIQQTAEGKERDKLAAKGQTELDSTLSQSADYELILPEGYKDANGQTKFDTKATTLSLSKPVNIDFYDPEASKGFAGSKSYGKGQNRTGEPAKINRLFALEEGKTGKDQRYVVEFNAYRKDLEMSPEAFEKLSEIEQLLYKVSSSGEYYKLDESRPLYKYINEGDLTWNAIGSAIAKESKATSADASNRMKGIIPTNDVKNPFSK